MEALKGMRITALPLVLLLLAAACSKPKVVYEVDPDFPKASFHTLALDPRKDLVIIREGLRPLDPAESRQVVLSELRSRRYQAVPAPEADLWVTVFLLGRSAEPRAARTVAITVARGAKEARAAWMAVPWAGAVLAD